MRRRAAAVTTEMRRFVRDEAMLAVDHHYLPERAGNRAGCRRVTHRSADSLIAARSDAIGARSQLLSDNYATASPILARWA